MKNKVKVRLNKLNQKMGIWCHLPPKFFNAVEEMAAAVFIGLLISVAIFIVIFIVI